VSTHCSSSTPCFCTVALVAWWTLCGMSVSFSLLSSFLVLLFLSCELLFLILFHVYTYTPHCRSRSPSLRIVCIFLLLFSFLFFFSPLLLSPVSIHPISFKTMTLVVSSKSASGRRGKRRHTHADASRILCQVVRGGGGSPYRNSQNEVLFLTQVFAAVSVDLDLDLCNPLSSFADTLSCWTLWGGRLRCIPSSPPLHSSPLLAAFARLTSRALLRKEHCKWTGAAFTHLWHCL
jgi:hypothetical protein